MPWAAALVWRNFVRRPRVVVGVRFIGRLVFVFVALGAAAAPAVAQQSVVDVVQRPTQVRDDGGRVLYSDFDAATGRYRLVVHDGARKLAVPVAPQPEPLDADIGTDTAGRASVIVSLCGRPAGPDRRSGGCDLFVHRLGAGGLRAVTNANTPDAETGPTISRGRIAFARTYRFGAGPIVYAKRLIAPRSRPSRRLPGVPQRRQGKRTARRSVVALELAGDSLGQSVTYDFRGAAGFRQNEIRLVDVDDGTSRQVARMVTGLGVQSFEGLSFAAGYLSWYKACAACDQDGSFGPYRYRPGSAYLRDRGPLAVAGWSWFGSGAFRVTTGGGETRCEGLAEGGCPIRRIADPDWDVVAAKRVRD